MGNYLGFWDEVLIRFYGLYWVELESFGAERGLARADR